MSFVRLELADGPPCPHCGCQDVRITQEPTGGTWWPSGRAVCNHCRTQFAFRERPAAVGDPSGGPAPVETRGGERDAAYPVRGCPECGSPNTEVISSPRPKPGRPRIRYHRCKDCRTGGRATTFKSVDRRGEA